MLQGHKVMNASDEAVLVRQLRAVCDDSPLNATVFHPYFIYFDQVIINYKYVK